MNIRQMLVAVVLISWAGALQADAPAPAVDPAYQKEAGPYRVIDFASVTLRDEGRGRDVEVRIRGPRGVKDGPAPLVIFSHGAGGDKDAFGALCAHLASHGYVVVNPTHSDSVKLRRRLGEQFDPKNADIARQVVGKVNLPDRLADVRLVLGSLAKIEEALNAKPGAGEPRSLKIDPQRVALAGHSAGAFTTQTAAGLKFFPRGRGRGIGMAEPRIKAFVVISGQGSTRPSLRKESWEAMTRPMLVIAGSRDVSAVSDETPKSRRHPYELAPKGDKYLVYIDGATHGSYAGKDVVRVLGEKPPENIPYITDIVQFSTQAFLDAFLGGSEAAKSYLQSDALTRYAGGKTEYLRK